MQNRGEYLVRLYLYETYFPLLDLNIPAENMIILSKSVAKLLHLYTHSLRSLNFKKSLLLYLHCKLYQLYKMYKFDKLDKFYALKTQKCEIHEFVK